MILDWFTDLHPIIQAALATLFTWGVTALGAGLVFFFKRVNQGVLNTMMGFAAGVMIAASFWSLLAPAIELAEKLEQIGWLIAGIGFACGGLFLWGVDKILPQFHVQPMREGTQGINTQWRRSILLVTAITLHNIPEGLAVGVAFGVIGSGMDAGSLTGAIALALGIGIQNFPEGAAVSVPLRRDGMGVGRAFWYGQLSGFVELISGVLGAWAALTLQNILPFALAFAAGAMIYVVADELIPSSQENRQGKWATWGLMIGFMVMMILDVGLG